jgi:cytochrome c
MKFLPPIASCLALLVLCVPARAQDPVHHGRALAKKFCASCHAIGKTGKSPHEEAPPFRRLGRVVDLDSFPGIMIHGLSSNHPDMPQFDFSPRDAVDLRDYLRTIQE